MLPGWSSATPSSAVAFVLHETFEEFQVAGFPICQVGFLDHYRRADAPGECRLVNELNVYKEDAFLEFVFHPINDLCREHQDIVCRAREAWVSAFFFSYLDFCSFPSPQLSSLRDHETRDNVAWSYCRVDAAKGNPSSRRCSIQLSGKRWVSFLKLRSVRWF